MDGAWNFKELRLLNVLITYILKLKFVNETTMTFTCLFINITHIYNADDTKEINKRA